MQDHTTRSFGLEYKNKIKNKQTAENLNKNSVAAVKESNAGCIVMSKISISTTHISVNIQ